MLKYLQNYYLRRCPRARPQKIGGSANKMVVFANRLYIDTYLFVINIEYLLQRLRRGPKDVKLPKPSMGTVKIIGKQTG
jgi:hypothetical protein